MLFLAFILNILFNMKIILGQREYKFLFLLNIFTNYVDIYVG